MECNCLRCYLKSEYIKALDKQLEKEILGESYIKENKTKVITMIRGDR